MGKVPNPTVGAGGQNINMQISTVQGSAIFGSEARNRQVWEISATLLFRNNVKHPDHTETILHHPIQP